jgi:hypothetical protein
VRNGKPKAIPSVAELDMRDYFAAQAMQAFIGKLVNGDETSSALIPELSYAMADVMLKAREGA